MLDISLNYNVLFFYGGRFYKMTRKKLPNGLTQQQEDFCKHYVNIGIGSEAVKKAYPKSKNWKRNTLDCQVQKLLNNELINHRINELNEQKTSALLQSTKISHRKLLETALQTMIECNTPAERQHFVSLIKMLFQKEGMLQPQNQVNIQVNNNTVVGEVTDYLDL
jgi:hypothetical protein